MITPANSSEMVLVRACKQVGLTYEDAALLRAHSASVYLLPRESTVARISSYEHQGVQAKASVAIARWLVEQDFPATEPLLDHAIEVDSSVVTFWRYYSQKGREKPPARALGLILRRLHGLRPPPFRLPAYQPLMGLLRALERPNVLGDDDRAWLKERAEFLIQQYYQLDSHLGVGFVHGDAYRGNTLWGPHGVLLGDWDEASVAPRELDLVNIYQGVRYGVSDDVFDEFTAAYGWDVREWSGFTVLREMRDLHTLTGFVRRSVAEPGAAEELRRRTESLRYPKPEAGVLWRSST
ncbi:aminoglycoside phosphotransferase family protein [Nocardia sp. BMG51109]|uniref:aminoglycoside phosphotransferase family protein n=1 Tax=Nocardia sp. BMG51109 TaxID=1056816 RepID=UPI000464F176|nr:aminoglycoside phosphotransferase family protein [Nocardia sp. BMG51109]